MVCAITPTNPTQDKTNSNANATSLLSSPELGFLASSWHLFSKDLIAPALTFLCTSCPRHLLNAHNALRQRRWLSRSPSLEAFSTTSQSSKAQLYHATGIVSFETKSQLRLLIAVSTFCVSPNSSLCSRSNFNKCKHDGYAVLRSKSTISPPNCTGS